MEQEINPTAFNSTNAHHVEEPMAWYEFILPVAAFLGAIVCIATSIIIFANKALHSRKYYSIAVFCLSYTLYLFICPIISEIAPRFHKHISNTMLCIGAHALFETWFSTLAFLQTLFLDWYIENHCSKSCSSKYLTASKYMSVSIGVITFCLFLTTTITCHQGYSFPLPIILALLTYFGVFITIILLTVIHLFKKKKSNSEIEYTNVVFYVVIGYFVCWLGHFLMIIWTFVRRFHSLPTPLFILINCLTFLNPLVTFVILYKLDEKFRSCIFKSRSTDVVEAHKNPVRI